MSDAQDKTDFDGIPRTDTSSPIRNENHPDDNKLQDLIEQDTTLNQKHFENEVLAHQRNETNENVSDEKSESSFEENGTSNEHLSNEKEVAHSRKTSIDDAKKKELVSEIETNFDVESLESSNATSEAAGKSCEENADLSIQNKTSGTMTDSWRTDSVESSTDNEIQVLEDENKTGSETGDEIQDENKTGSETGDEIQDVNRTGSETGDEIQDVNRTGSETGDEIQNLTSDVSSTDEEVQVLEDLKDYTDNQNVNSDRDLITSSVDAIKTKNEQIPVSEEQSISEEYVIVSQSIQATEDVTEIVDVTSSGSSTDENIKVVEDCTDKKNLNSDNDVVSSVEQMKSKVEKMPVSLEITTTKEEDKASQGTHVADYTVEGRILNSGDFNLSAVKNAETSTEDGLEDSKVSQSTQVPEDKEGQNSISGNYPKVTEMVNTGISTEGSVGEAKVSQSIQVPEYTVEENTNTQNYSKVVENIGSTDDSGNKEISNYRESSPNEKCKISENVTEVLSRRLNSEEFKNNLTKINDIVKQLTAAEFMSSNLSPEDREDLNELYSQQDQNMDGEAHSEISDSNAAKRKSKESPESDDDLQAISKKYKLSKNLGSSECLDCLEEQFRIASELSSEDNEEQSQREKVYKFPVTSSGENQERRYKVCKHQIAKLDAMVVSAVSMEHYLFQLNNEMGNVMSAEDFGSNEISSGSSACLKHQSKVPKSESSSARTRKFSKKNVTLQQKSIHDKERISQPKEQLAEVEKDPKGYGYFGIGEAFNCIKNLILFAAFTGSLTIAITVAKIFGVTFPVPKSQRNLRNDSESSLQEFPDVNLDES